MTSIRSRWKCDASLHLAEQSYAHHFGWESQRKKTLSHLHHHIFFVCFVFHVSRVYFVLFLLDLPRLQLICSSSRFDTGAAFWRSKVIQFFLQFPQLWTGFWSIKRYSSSLLRATEKWSPEKEILQGRVTHLSHTMAGNTAHNEQLIRNKAKKKIQKTNKHENHCSFYRLQNESIISAETPWTV